MNTTAAELIEEALVTIQTIKKINLLVKGLKKDAPARFGIQRQINRLEGMAEDLQADADFKTTFADRLIELERSNGT